MEILIEWFEDLDETILCSMDCGLWNAFREECTLRYDKEDIGVPGKDCPGPGKYDVTLTKVQS